MCKGNDTLLNNLLEGYRPACMDEDTFNYAYILARMWQKLEPYCNKRANIVTAIALLHNKPSPNAKEKIGRLWQTCKNFDGSEEGTKNLNEQIMSLLGTYTRK